MDTKLYRLNNNRKIIPVNIKTHIFASRYGYSIIVSDRVVWNSLLIAGRIQNRVFPEVILERIAATGGVCKVSVGEGVVIEMDKEIAEETVYIISSLGEQNIELDIEEVEKRKINLYYGGWSFSGYFSPW